MTDQYTYIYIIYTDLDRNNKYLNHLSKDNRVHLDKI